MILLRHLRIHAFKHLRDVNLWLPRRGSILIEGHNESGKSTLFEAIYFALYGKALVGEDQGNPSLEALLPHGEAHADVQLTITAGVTELEITRTLTRGRNGQQVKHDAVARIHRPGMPVETISAVKAVNDCILNEMNGLDSNVLRNSCLMEQQALDRIETLSTDNREMAIAKLLGIEALQKIEKDLKVARKDEAQLAQAKVRLDVARQQREAHQANEAARQAAVALQAARAGAALLTRDALTNQLQTARNDLDVVTLEAAGLRDRSQRVATLEALRIRGEEAGQHLREAEQQAAALEMLRAGQGHSASAEVAEAGRSGQLARVAEDITAAEAGEREQRSQVAASQRRGRSSGMLALVMFVAVAVIGAVVLLTGIKGLLVIVFGLLGVAVVLAIRWQSNTRAAKDGHAKLEALDRELIRLRGAHEALQQIGASVDEQHVVAPAEMAAQQQRADSSRETCARDLHELADALAGAGIVGIGASMGELPLASVVELRQAHEALFQPLRAELARMDVQAAQRQQGSLDVREQHLRAAMDEYVSQRENERTRLIALLAEQGIASTGDESWEALAARWPALNDAGNPDALAATLERASAIAEQLRQRVATLCSQHGFDAETLDADACQKEYDALEREQRQRRLAAEMADEVFKRIVKRVLPETEMHMRALLPELTDGRYRDVSLLDGDEGSADLRIRVWDEQAGRYVGKHLFSGGTRDQCSLALRLAFALATLPKELGAMPGFIFLDEPLSSFDDRRSQALVDVLTRGPIARQFPQVFLISHSQSFDPNAFTCALRMSGGRIARSSLPNEAAARTLWDAELSPATN